jgi:hypothetical protein
MVELLKQDAIKDFSLITENVSAALKEVHGMEKIVSRILTVTSISNDSDSSKNNLT